MHLYNQLEKGMQMADRTQLVHRALPPSEAAVLLKSLMGHRHELIHESSRRKNQLTALCDQLFPEFTRVFKDPNAPTALAVRARFPTAQAMATATVEALCDATSRRYPGRVEMARLHEFAAQSIGVKDGGRQRALAFEQVQLIAELRLSREHIDRIDAEIAQIIAHAREGRILLSLPGIGETSAAAIIAAVGHIDNFPNAASLKSYFGWAPTLTQTGVTRDSAGMTRAGERTMKEIMYLAAIRCVREGGEFAPLYRRLVERKCPYDERTRTYTGKMKVIGRIAGQLTRMIYAFLKADADLLAATPAGCHPPDPMLYDPAVHKAHMAGRYRSMKPCPASTRMVQLPRRDSPTGAQEVAGSGGAQPPGDRGRQAEAPRLDGQGGVPC